MHIVFVFLKIKIICIFYICISYISIMKQHKKHFWAFTLVELIIVVTILAILATIAFISFRNYSWNARDGNKLTTFSTIEKWFTLYQLKTWTYPQPDNIYGSWNYSWTLLVEVWFVWTGTVQALHMNKIPKDPIVDFEYTYWLSSDKRYYQLWTVLENNQVSIIDQTYAANYTSKLVWNYRGLYRFSTWWINYISNLPSLIFTESGVVNLENWLNNPKFVINIGWNLVKPYDERNDESINTILEKLTGTWGISFEVEVVPTDWNSGSWILKDILWYSEDEIWYEIYGEKYKNKNHWEFLTLPIVYASCNFSGDIVEHGISVTAYQIPNVSFWSMCVSEQRNCDNWTLSWSFTYASCNVDGVTGTFTLSQTSIDIGTNVTISNTCSTAPISYISSNEWVATISWNTITTISAWTTTITPVGWACWDNGGKILTVTLPVCTNFTYSTWWACQPNNTQTRTILTQSPSGCIGWSPEALEQSCTYTATSIVQNLCTASGQIIYTDNNWVEIWRVNSAWNSTSGTPWNLTIHWHIVMCSWNKTWYVIRAINQWAGAINQNWNYYQWGNNWWWTASASTSTTRPTCSSNSSMNHTVFVTWFTDWCSAQNDNVWWNVTNTSIARRWPCPENYHLPTQAEWQAVITAWNWWTNGINFINAFKIPMAWARNYDGSLYNYWWIYWYYWTSSPNGAMSYYLFFNSWDVKVTEYVYRATWFAIRCFKN